MAKKLSSRKAEKKFHFGSLLVELDQSRPLDEIMDADEFFREDGLPSMEVVLRFRRLEAFYRCVRELRRVAEHRILTGLKPEREDAITEFVKKMGLAIDTMDQRRAIWLALYANFLMEKGHLEELCNAMKERRKANIPLEDRVAGVAFVQKKIGVKEWAAARRRLSDAKRKLPAPLKDFALFSCLPLPGGDLG